MHGCHSEIVIGSIKNLDLRAGVWTSTSLLVGLLNAQGHSNSCSIDVEISLVTKKDWLSPVINC
jgi:hypothetical protein